MDTHLDDARQSLSAITASTKKMKRSISSRYTAPLLILWGTIWVLAFLGTFFYMTSANLIWLVVDIIGIGGTFFIIWYQMKKADPVKVNPNSKSTRRLFFFWLLMFMYGYLWLYILAPANGLQMNAFLCTLLMFAWIMMGMWLDEKVLIWLCLLITLTTVVGFFLIPHSWYCLWMAATGGAPMLGTGLYMRLAWK
jgi:hypothetical protein